MTGYDYAQLAACTAAMAFWLGLIWRDTRPRPPLPRGEDLRELFL